MWDFSGIGMATEMLSDVTSATQVGASDRFFNQIVSVFEMMERFLTETI
jgi:hypothetical protein